MAAPNTDLDTLVQQCRDAPTNVRLIRQTVVQLQKAGRLQDIAELQGLSAQANPDNSAFHRQHIAAWIKVGNNEAAADAAAAALERIIDDPAMEMLIFQTLAKSSRWQESAGLASKLARNHPSDYPLVGRCLSILRAAGMEDKAGNISACYLKTTGRRQILELWSDRLPYMIDYYDGGHLTTWMPYVMTAAPANFKTPAYSTDAKGYRYSQAADGTLFSPSDDTDQRGNMALVGGSTAFGVGSTSDATTTASLLSQGDRYCYNLGSRAAVIQQNTIQFLFDLKTFSNLKHIAILSGWNELAVVHRCKVFPKQYGPFFSWNAYTRHFNPTISNFPEEDWPAPIRDHMSTECDRKGSLPINEMLDVIEKMLLAWKVLSSHSGAELTYILQPNISWAKRQAPKEEVELLSDLADVSGTEAREILEFMADKHDWYTGKLKRLCEKHGIRFLDANVLIENHPDRDQWLFADPAHLTDSGARVLAEVLTQEFQHG